MEAQERSLQVPRTSRYHILGKPSEKVERIWLACHGYGQLPKFFIKNFEPLAGKKDLIIAPEGLSRFYLRGNGGRVGASWMTKEARLTEIQDQRTQLDLVLEQNLALLAHSPKVIAFGFSQGTATVMRWAASTDHEIGAIVCWAGTVPPDLDQSKAQKRLHGKTAVIALGDQDPYLSMSDVQRDKELLEAFGTQVIHLDFKGEHTLPGEALGRLPAMLGYAP